MLMGQAGHVLLHRLLLACLIYFDRCRAVPCVELLDASMGPDAVRAYGGQDTRTVQFGPSKRGGKT